MGSGSRVAMSCGGGHRRGSDPVLLWLSCRWAAPAPIEPLAWEPPYATTDVAVKDKKTKKKERKKVVSAWATPYRNNENHKLLTEDRV